MSESKDNVGTEAIPSQEISQTGKESAVEASSSPSKVTREDLLELVRAIKFAKPDASQKQIHAEITGELSKKDGFEFLKDVALNDVKKVWKKAVHQQANPGHPSTATTSASSTNADLMEKLQLQDKAPTLFTVGSNNSVQFLAQEYTASVLVAQRQEAEEKLKDETELQETLARDYVHVFLDVPADKSGSRPHQALINFQSGQKDSEQKSSLAGNKKKKGKKKSTGGTRGPASGSTLDPEGREIVKIQCAAPLPEDNNTPIQQFPMLLYNQNRSHRTFIHADPDDESRGYERIQSWIANTGQQGALGQAGGTKAYFYARLTVSSGGNKTGSHPPILSIDVTELAPPQAW